MEFKFLEKESYSLNEVKEIISQHNGFKEKQYKGYIPQEELAKIKEELKPYKEKAFNDKIRSLFPENANSKYSKDIIVLANINQDDDEDVIKKKLNETITTREFFQVKVNDETATKPEIKPIKVETTPQIKDKNTPMYKKVAKEM